LFFLFALLELSSLRPGSALCFPFPLVLVSCASRLSLESFLTHYYAQFFLLFFLRILYDPSFPRSAYRYSLSTPRLVDRLPPVSPSLLFFKERRSFNLPLRPLSLIPTSLCVPPSLILIISFIPYCHNQFPFAMKRFLSCLILFIYEHPFFVFAILPRRDPPFFFQDVAYPSSILFSHRNKESEALTVEHFFFSRSCIPGLYSSFS